MKSVGEHYCNRLRGYGRDAIPSYICAHPCHLWEALLCKGFCVFGAFRGSFFTACFVGAVLALASGKAERRQVHPLECTP